MATARATWRSVRAISMTSVSLRLTSLFGGVALLHLVGWGIMLLLVAPRYPVMLGLGGLAYAFGLRHATRHRQQHAAAIARLHEVAQVIERDYTGETARFKARIPHDVRREFAAFIVPEVNETAVHGINGARTGRREDG